MKHFIIILSILFIAPSLSAMTPEAMADSIRNEQNRKSINDIKLEENALYAEIREAIYIGDEGEDEDMAKVKALTKAQQKSIQLLQTHVIEVFAKRLKMSKQDVQEIWDVIDDKCQNIEVKRGDLFRVFSYVMKDALRIGLKGRLDPEEIAKVLGDESSVEQEDVQTAPTVITPPAAPTYLLSIEATEGGQVNKGGEYHAGTNVAIEATPNEGFYFAGWTTQNGDTLSKELNFNYTMQAKATTLTACFAKKQEVKQPETEPETKLEVEPETEPKVETPEPPLPPVVKQTVEVPSLCNTILEKGDMTALLTFLDGEKAFQKLIYGSQKNMKSPEKCYIVIVEKKSRKVKTVLGPGETERMNYVTKQSDNYNNYRGSGDYMAVFVQELK